MKRFAAAALALTLAGALPAFAQVSPGRDNSNMAYPTPLPQGNVGTTTLGTPTTPTDTGNMAYPAPMQQGNVGTTAQGRPTAPADTGNMAYPTPVPQGNVGNNSVPK